MTNPCIVHTFIMSAIQNSTLSSRRTRMYSNYITPSNFIALTVTHLEVGDGTKQPYSLSIGWHIPDPLILWPRILFSFSK